MLSVKMTCEIPQDRIVALRLPSTIAPGIHELVVIIDEHAATRENTQADALMKFAGAWKKNGHDSVDYQRHIREEWS